MLKLLKNAEVYAPAYLGKKDVLVIGDKIARMEDKIEGYDALPEVEVFDLSGKKLAPGYIDLTEGSTPEVMETRAGLIMELLSWEGVSIDHISMSSDAFGSQPKFNSIGECIGLTYCSPKFLHLTIKSLIRRGLPLEQALKLLTSTPAEILGLTGIKGCVKEGADADLLVLDENLDIDGLFAKGKTAILNKEIIMKGRFE